MDAFATVADLKRRTTVSDEERAETALMDASVIMVAAMKKSGVDYSSPDELQQAALVAVCCNMVKRTLAVDDDIPGVTQYSQGANGFSESWSYANPSGDLYMTKAERQMLGIHGVISTARAEIHNPDGSLVDGW